MKMHGFLRPDGRKGIRDVLVVVYLVECAHHVARRIVDLADDTQVHLIGFPGCYPNSYAHRMMSALIVHPNVGGVVLLSLGCESFDRSALASHAANAGRPVETVVIQNNGGTRGAISAGLAAVQRVRAEMHDRAVPVDIDWSELVIGTICGGSDGTSGITANPVVGRVFDALVDRGATCIFEETGEMIGCEGPMAVRTVDAGVSTAIESAISKAARYYTLMGYGSFAPGNADGGLSSQEEKSAGAYAKSGSRPIIGVIKPTDQPTKPGLYLLDVVPDGDPLFGFPNIADNAEIVEMIASGCHMTLFTTGRGSVVGSAIAPVIKICANPDTFRALAEDMDIDAGKILDGGGTLEGVADELINVIECVASGLETKSEELGHREFILTYKTFEPTGPSCMPRAA